jgi:hypothetical protein
MDLIDGHDKHTIHHYDNITFTPLPSPFCPLLAELRLAEESFDEAPLLRTSDSDDRWKRPDGTSAREPFGNTPS